jgi:hypothetical protein
MKESPLLRNQMHTTVVFSLVKESNKKNGASVSDSVVGLNKAECRERESLVLAEKYVKLISGRFMLRCDLCT